MAVDKELAIKLRLEGRTHKDIAERLHCSLSWVKANLKGLRKPGKDTTLIDIVRTIGRSPNGITTGEARTLVMQHEPTLKGKALNDKVAQLKQQAKRGCKDVIIRPYWMLPECPHDCINTIMDMSQHVYELVDELATKYRKLYDLDSSFHRSIVYQISTLSSGDGSPSLPQGLMTYGDQIGFIADTLDERQ